MKTTRKKGGESPQGSGPGPGGSKTGPGATREGAPQSPWPSLKEIEEAVRECVSGNCGRVRTIIKMTAYIDSPLMIIGSYVVNALRNYGFSESKIYQITMIDWNALRRLLRLGDVFEFSRISGFRPRSFFDAYWMFTSLVTLRLPFIVKSRFDPPNDICGAFEDEELCHMYIAGYLIAESLKSNIPSRRFKLVSTTHPATVATMLSITNHFAKYEIKTKVYIHEKYREVVFIFSDLPEDVEQLLEEVLRDPAILVKLSDEEFLAFLAGLLAGDGSIKLSNFAEVMLTGNLEKEKSLYAVIQSELRRRLGVETFLSERKNSNAIILYTWGYDVMRFVQMLPPLIEPLKELRKQVLLKRDVIGVFTASRLFRLLGDGKRKGGTRGIRKLQSYQSVRFFMVLVRLGLIKLTEVKGFKYHILETPTNPRGRLP